MELDNEYLDRFEGSVNRVLYDFLTSKGAVDRILPDADDILGKWEGICMSYLPFGVKEFTDYPTASLGWMMFVGMAVAKFWDEDWTRYDQVDDLYMMLHEVRGYDELDEMILQDILALSPEEQKKTDTLVADAATKVLDLLRKENFEPGTPTAFNAYVRCLHQLYYFGAAVELRRLGYHMTEFNPN